MRLFEEMRKNVLTLMRSPAAMVTLILGPLLLLVLVGFALSGTEAHGIRVGITGDMPSALLLNGSVERFDTPGACIDALRHQTIHLCVEFVDFSTQDVPQGTVLFHFDETRQKVSTIVLQEVSRALGGESSRIRVGAVQGLLDEFGRIASLMSQKRQDLLDLRQEALAIRADVTQRRIALEQEQETFRATALPLREALNATTDAAGTQAILAQDIIDAGTALVDAAAVLNISNTSDVKQDLVDLAAAAGVAQAQLNITQEQAARVNAALDGIDSRYTEEIAAARAYETKVDAGVTKLDATVLQLDADIEKLRGLDPSLAKRIDTPIIQEVRPLFERLRAIEAGFAQLFIIVITFIATLFGAIVTLLEINSRATLRNSLMPTSEAWTVVAACCTSLIVVALQGGVLLLVAQKLLDIDVQAALGSYALIGLGVALTFVTLGTAIALRLRKPQAAILVSTFAALIVLLFSDVLTALELMPETIASIVSYNPLVVASRILLKEQLFGIPPAQEAMLVLGALLVAAIILCALAYRNYKAAVSRW